MRPGPGGRRAAGAGVLAVLLAGPIPGVLPGLLPGATAAAATPAGGLEVPELEVPGLEVPEVVRLGGGSLGAQRVFESAPIRVRLDPVPGPRIVRLLLEMPDPRWSGAEVTFTTTAARGCTGLGGALQRGVPTPVLRTAPGAAAAEAEIVLRIRTPARGLGAGPRALRLRWDAVEDPREPFATSPQRPSGQPAGRAPGQPPDGGFGPTWVPTTREPSPRGRERESVEPPAAPPPSSGSPHSARSATIGSTRVAARAGR